MLAVISLESPFDPQALYTAINYVSYIFDSSSWQNLLKMFFMIALINGIISVAIFQKTDYFKQFLVALAFSGVLSAPVNDNISISRGMTEKAYTISNSKAPWVLIEGFRVINNVTKWFTLKAGAGINSYDSTGMYSAGIGSYGNLLKNSMDISFKNPLVRVNMMQFFKECTLYDIKDGAINLNELMENGNGFPLMFNNTSPARFVTINFTTANSSVKTCTDAAAQLKNDIHYDTAKTVEDKGRQFFYKSDLYSQTYMSSLYYSAVQSAYQNQLQINTNMAEIMQQNMFNYMMEQTGPDFARMLTDPSLAENAAIHMATSRAAKKASFQQSVIAQLGRELMPAMGSWIAIILIMLFPFVILLFVLAPLGNMLQVLFGYLGTLFWICMWQPIFAIINGLANWELGRQLAVTGAFNKTGIPYGYVNTVYDTLINNQSLVGWMVLLTPVIASAVAFGTYKSIASIGNSVMSTFSGAGAAVGGEMSDGNTSMGNSSFANTSVGNDSRDNYSRDNRSWNNASANKLDTNAVTSSGLTKVNDGKGTTYTFGGDGWVAKTYDKDDSLAHIKVSKTAAATKGIGNESSTSFNKTKNTAVTTNEGIESTTTASDTNTLGTTQSQGQSVAQIQNKEISTSTTGSSQFTSNANTNFSQTDSNTGNTTVGLNANTHVGGTFGVGSGGGVGGNMIGNSAAGATDRGTAAGGGKGSKLGNLLGKAANSTSRGGGYVNAGAGGTIGTTVGATETGSSQASSSYSAGDAATKSISDNQGITSTDGINRNMTQSNQTESSQVSSYNSQRSRREGYSLSTGEESQLTQGTSYKRSSNANETSSVTRETDLTLPSNQNFALDWLIGNGFEKEAGEILTSPSMNGRFTDQNGKADFEAYKSGGGLEKSDAKEQLAELFSEKSSDITSHTLNNGGNKPLGDAQNITSYDEEKGRLTNRFDKADTGFKVSDKTHRIKNNYGEKPLERKADSLIGTGKDRTRDLVKQTTDGIGGQVQKYTKPNNQKNSVYRSAGNLANGDRAQEVLSLFGGNDSKKE